MNGGDKMSKEELLGSLTKEQLDKVHACRNNNELMFLARLEGIELTEEQLESVVGGGCGNNGDPDNDGKPGAPIKDLY
jgi:hypothetical protein